VTWFRKSLYGILGVGSKRNETITKGIGKTCWRELESYLSRGRKGVGSKKVTLANI